MPQYMGNVVVTEDEIDLINRLCEADGIKSHVFIYDSIKRMSMHVSGYIYESPHGAWATPRLLAEWPKVLKRFADQSFRCERCGDRVIARIGKTGPQITCMSFPACLNYDLIRHKTIDLTAQFAMLGYVPNCPLCSFPLFVFRGPRGLFLACDRNAACEQSELMQKGLMEYVPS